MSRIMSLCAALFLIVAATIAVTSPASAQEDTSSFDCSAYLYREDAQLAAQDLSVCNELPSRSTALQCFDFLTQEGAQGYFNQDPYTFRNLTNYGRGIGDLDSTTACPELPSADDYLASVGIDSPDGQAAVAELQSVGAPVPTAEEIAAADPDATTDETVTDTSSVTGAETTVSSLPNTGVGPTSGQDATMILLIAGSLIAAAGAGAFRIAQMDQTR